MTQQRSKPIRGTREWAVANIDCCTGCPHDCRYCYARYEAIGKKGDATRESWSECVLREQDVHREFPCYEGQVMFPTTHDIVPEILEACIEVIDRLLRAGNKVLVVSKPHRECIERLCSEFFQRKDKILFRFTVTARNQQLLDFWEPGAPSYQERKECLCHAFNAGFNTSVSVEPMLDSDDVVKMFHELAPCTSHSIWIGKMNRVRERVQVKTVKERAEVACILKGQRDDKIRGIYSQLKHEPLVRWKESIKEVIGLELQDEAGLDI